MLTHQRIEEAAYSRWCAPAGTDAQDWLASECDLLGQAVDRHRGANMNLEPYIKTSVPIVIWGPPGSGKSQMVAHEARRLGRPLEVLIPPIMQPEDFLLETRRDCWGSRGRSR